MPARDSTTHLVMSPLGFMQRLAVFRCVRTHPPRSTSRPSIATAGYPPWVDSCRRRPERAAARSCSTADVGCLARLRTGSPGQQPTVMTGGSAVIHLTVRAFCCPPWLAPGPGVLPIRVANTTHHRAHSLQSWRPPRKARTRSAPPPSTRARADPQFQSTNRSDSPVLPTKHDIDTRGPPLEARTACTRLDSIRISSPTPGLISTAEGGSLLLSRKS